MDISNSSPPSFTMEVRRPSVQRASSAPESLDTDSSGALLLAANDRPTFPRACSESHANGVLERRRRKGASEDGSLPHLMILDFGSIPKTFGTTNPSLIKAARRAAQEPREWDWGFAVPRGAEAMTKQHESTSYFDVGMQAKNGAAASCTAKHSRRSGSGGGPSRQGSLRRARQPRAAACAQSSSYAYDSEWDWALGGHSRMSDEMYSAPRDVHKTPTAAESPNADEVYMAMQAKFASFLPESKRLKARLRTLRVQSQKLFHHQHKTSVQLSSVEASVAGLRLDSGSGTASCPFAGAREHALGVRRSRSMERCSAIS